MMDAIQIADYARALRSAHGDRAEAEAARRMRECKDAGKSDEAGDWHKIRRAISEMRGPAQG